MTLHEQAKPIFPPQVNTPFPQTTYEDNIRAITLTARIHREEHFQISSSSKQNTEFTLHQTSDIYPSLGLHEDWERKLGG